MSVTFLTNDDKQELLEAMENVELSAVDQIFDPESPNAISGIAVNEAIKNQSEVEYTAKRLMLNFESSKVCDIEMHSDASEVKLWHGHKNLLPKFPSKTIAGVTMTVEDDGTIVFNGTFSHGAGATASVIVNSVDLGGMPFTTGPDSIHYTSMWYDTPAPQSSGTIMFRILNDTSQNLSSSSATANATAGYSVTQQASSVASATESILAAQLYFYNVANGTVFDNWRVKCQLEIANYASGVYSEPSLTTYTVPVIDGVASESLSTFVGENYFASNATDLSLRTSTQVPTQSWLGKRWACFGDSITDKASITSGVRYHDIVSAELGLSVVNYGKATTGYATTGNASNGDYYKRMEYIDSDGFDFMTIMGSTNDIGPLARGEIELGTYTDTGTETVCGCINTTIDKFYELAPTKKLGVMTMLPTYSYGPNLIDLASAENYVNELIKICKNRGIPCLDLYHGSGLRPWVAEVKAEMFINGDGIHPNEKGIAFFAPMVREFVKSLI